MVRSQTQLDGMHSWHQWWSVADSSCAGHQVKSWSFSSSSATRSTIRAGITTSPWYWCTSTAVSTLSSTPQSTASSDRPWDVSLRDWINSNLKWLSSPDMWRSSTISVVVVTGAANYSRQTFPWTICRSVGASVCPVHCGKRRIGSRCR